MAPQSVPVIHSEYLVWSFVVSPGSLTLPEEWMRVIWLGWVEGAGGGEEVGTGIDSKMRKVVCFLKKIFKKEIRNCKLLLHPFNKTEKFYIF